MKKDKDIRFASSNGTDTVQGYAYEPETEICAVLQISHGMCEYIERYEPFIRYMTERGFAVYGNDHLGHGQTAGIDKLGFFAEKDGRKYVIKDLYTMTQYAKKRWPGKPFFFAGPQHGVVCGPAIHSRIRAGAGRRNFHGHQRQKPDGLGRDYDGICFSCAERKTGQKQDD